VQENHVFSQIPETGYQPEDKHVFSFCSESGLHLYCDLLKIVP